MQSSKMKAKDGSIIELVDNRISDADITNWNSKQNSLTFDTTPTADSNNPITSGGVKTAIDTVDAKGIVINEINGENVICFE